MEPLQPGDPERVGDCRLLSRLGAGGMGVVYLGRTPGGRKVAVKVIRERFAGDAEYRARFRREVSAARRVTGAFTAPVLEADPEAAAPWLITAYLPGLTLREAVSGHGALPVTAVRTLAAGLAEALADIHRAGLAHRDLKPANIMLTTGGPRVIDFGIARPEDATAITQVGTVIGTPGFMSPERIAGGEAGPAGDVFSLGSVLLFAATGTEPFGSGESVATPNRVVLGRADLSGVTDGALRDIVTNCLRLDPAQRPSAAGLLEELDGLDDANGLEGPEEPPRSGSGWLPAVLAEAIDRRAARARDLPDAPLDRPGPDLGRPPAADPALMADATVEPAAVDVVAVDVAAVDAAAEAQARGAPTEPPGPDRRKVTVAAAVALLSAGGAVALWRSRDTAPTPANGGARKPGSPTASPSSSSSPKPLRPDRRWKVRVSDYYPDLSAVGGVVLARSEDELRALDPGTGDIRWKRPKEFSGAAAGDTAYVVAPETWRLSAVDAASGDARWTYDPPFGEAPVSLVGTRSVVCFGYERLRALGADDGRQRWTAKVNAKHGLAAAGGVVAAVNSELTCLEADSGRTRWTYAVDNGANPHIGYGLVFLCDRFGTLHAVRSDSGRTAWRKDTGGTSFPLRLGAGVVYADGRDGEVLAMRAETGEELWSRRVGRGEGDPYGHSNAFGLHGDTLYVASTDRNLYALDVADGRVRWRHEVNATLSSGPAVLDGLVFVGTRDGHVQALRPPDGGARAGS